MKVLVTPRSFGKTDPEAFEILRRAGLDIAVNDSGGILDKECLAEMLADCDGVVLGVDPLDTDVIARAPKLKAVAKYGVGVDNIDLDACKARGISVTRTVGANANAVADYAFALIMAAARQVVKIDSMCRRGDWSKVTTIDIYGKTIGILGMGAIGKGVARRAKGFGMQVLGYDVYWDEKFATEEGIKRADLEEIYKNADFISLHVPLNDETRKMIGTAELAMMKPNAIIVNTARGGIIDEDALLAALKNKTIYGAGIDAFEKEPPENKEWFTLDNIVLGSHAAASTTGATESMGRAAAHNLLKDLGLE